MDIEKIADKILDEDYRYLDYWDNGDCMEQTFSSGSLREVIIRVIKEEIDASND